MKIMGMLKSHLEWKLMYLAAKLNIADILYQSPKTVMELESALNVDSQVFRRILRGFI